jgi:hypothetical protein
MLHPSGIASQAVLKRLAVRLPVWLSAAWAMGLTCLGFFVVPMLFASLPSKALAGAMAGQLFAVQTWISVVLAMTLLLLTRDPSVELRVPGHYVVSLLAGVLLALLVEFGVSPHIRAHENLGLWHPLGSAMYFAQWFCALWAFGHTTSFSSCASHRPAL